MNVVTIPKRMSGAKDDLILISRREYESLKARVIPEIVPTKADIRDLRAAEKRFAEGKFCSLDDVKRDVARRHRR